MSRDWKLRDLLIYDPDSGDFVWRARKPEHFRAVRDCTAWNGRYAGKPVWQKTDHQGYKLIKIGGQYRRAHRVAYEIIHGAIPAGLEIDHINGDRGDNRLANLRAVTHRENLRNISRHRDNTSGAMGVRKVTGFNRWQASIWDGARSVHLGTFATVEEATSARKVAEMEYGFHPNHGRSLTDQERQEALQEIKEGERV